MNNKTGCVVKTLLKINSSVDAGTGEFLDCLMVVFGKLAESDVVGFFARAEVRDAREEHVNGE